MSPRLDHLAIKVSSIENTIITLCSAGFLLKERSIHPDVGLKVAFLTIGSVEIELIESIHETSPLHNHPDGLHHLAIRYPDLQDAQRRIEKTGDVDVLSKPTQGVRGHPILFTRVKSADMLLELVEVNS